MAMAITSNTENRLLEDLYNREVKLDDVQDQKCQIVLTKVLKTVLETAKQKSPYFKELYRETYYGGSYYDKLKVNSTDFEFDLNIVFRIPKQVNWCISHLGDDVRKPNFANMQSTKHPTSGPESEAWNSLLTKDRQGHWVVSPKKMFEVLLTAVDRALTEISTVLVVNNETFRVTRSTGAPVILNVEGPGVKFTVDLVPSFKLELYHLKTACSDLNKRVLGMLKDFNIGVNTFMAIALKNASSDSFEVDFHDIERGLLDKSGGCVYKVIKLMKYLRDTKGGTIAKLWSHLLKTSVMHHVIRQEREYWNNGNLQTCFVDCIRNLWMGLQKEMITDIFFPEFNMLERIREGAVLTQACSWLDGLVKKHNMRDTVCVFFPELTNGGIASTGNVGHESLKELRVTVVKKEIAFGERVGNSPVEETKFECQICEKSFTGMESKEEHLRSKKHLNKVTENSEKDKQPQIKMSKPSENIIQSIFQFLLPKKEENQLERVPCSTSTVNNQQKLQMNPVNETELECKICEKSFTGIESKEDHFKSRKHLNKVSEANLQVVLPKKVMLQSNPAGESASKFYCNLCEKPFTGVESEAEHLKSKKHLNKVAEKAPKVVLPKKGDNKFECKTCDKLFTGIESKEEHFKSKKHLNKCREE